MAYIADETLNFFLFFAENRDRHFLQIVSSGDGMSTVFGEKIRKIPAKNNTMHAER